MPPPVGYEPTIPVGERPQTYALDRVATGTGPCIILGYNNIQTCAFLLHVLNLFYLLQGGIQQIQTYQWLFTQHMFNSTFKYKYYNDYRYESLIQNVCHDCYYLIANQYLLQKIFFVFRVISFCLLVFFVSTWMYTQTFLCTQ